MTNATTSPTAYLVTITPPAVPSSAIPGWTHQPPDTLQEVVSIPATRPPMPSLLRRVYAIVAERAEDAGEAVGEDDSNAWTAVLDTVADDLEHADRLAETGVRYSLPDGATLEAVGFDADPLEGLTDGATWSMLEADGVPVNMDPEHGETGGLGHLEPSRELRERVRVEVARFLLAARADDVQAFAEAFGDPDGGDPLHHVGHHVYMAAAGHGVAFTDDAHVPNMPPRTSYAAERARCAAELEAAGGRGVALAERVDALDLAMACERLQEAASAAGALEHLSAFDQGDGTAGL